MRRSILVAVDPDRSDPSAIPYAVARARDAHADLTLLCVWRPTRWLAYAAEGGEDPKALRESHGQEAAEWFRDRLAQVPYDIGVRSRFIEGFFGRQLLDELHTSHHDELVLGHRLRAFELVRLRRAVRSLEVMMLEIDRRR